VVPSCLGARSVHSPVLNAHDVRREAHRSGIAAGRDPKRRCGSRTPSGREPHLQPVGERVALAGAGDQGGLSAPFQALA